MPYIRTIDTFSIGNLSQSAIQSLVTLQPISTSLAKSMASGGYYIHRSSRCKFESSAAAIRAETSWPAYQNRQHWTIETTEVDRSSLDYSMLRQIIPILPHALELDASTIYSYPYQYYLLTSAIHSLYDATDDLLQQVSKFPLAFFADSFSVAQAKTQTNTMCQQISTAQGIGLLNAHSPQYYIRHDETAAWLSILLDRLISPSPPFSSFSFGPVASPFIMLALHIRSIFPFSLIITAEELATLDIQWWLIKFF